MSSEIDFSSLPDIRDIIPNHQAAQNGLLVSQVPCTYKAGPATAAARKIGNLNAMDVFVCIIRHLFCHLEPEFRGIYRDGASEEERARVERIRKVDEVENPLLRFAWSDLRFGDNDEAQCAVRKAIAERFNKKDSGITSLTFEGLAESPLMQRTLWYRECFQLYGPRPLSQPIETREPTAWDFFDARADTANMAQRSLLTWDGAGDLGTFVSDRFGQFKSESAGKKYVWYCNSPDIIRMRYRPTTKHYYSSLREMMVDCKKPRAGGTGSLRIPPPDEGSIRYQLVAVIRVGQATERDLIRRYTVEGAEILEPSEFAYIAQWTLSEADREFFLFYSRVENAAVPILPETLHWHKNWQENVRRVYAAMEALD